MRPFIGGLLVILAAALQATFNPQIRVFGGEPDLVFLIVLMWAARTPLQEAVALAFAGGLSIDLLSGTPLGLNTAALLPVAFAVAAVRDQLVGFGLPLVAAFAALGTLVYKLIVYVGVVIAGFALPPVTLFFFTVLPTLVYNLALLLPAYLLLRRLTRPPVPR
jgi:rod shape-determining protein MreD